MFLRFVSLAIDTDSRVSQGLFQAAYDLRDRGVLDEHERVWFQEVVGWFETNLAVPTPDDLILRRDAAVFERAVYWFRPGASEHIRKMHAVAAMLKHHGVSCRILKRANPGRIIYRDEFQVGAIPHRDGVK